MSQVQQAVDVDVPVRIAYNQWTQFESFPQFMEGVETVTQLDDTHNHWVVNVGGAKREFDTEITEQMPDERIAWRTVRGDVDQSGIVSFEPLEGAKTRVLIQIDWTPEGWTEAAGAAVGLDELRVKRDAGRFKDFIETRGSATGEWRGQV